ncbi:MAG: peptidylprolyl isomerase, partial [Candidatus Binatales bacterium]
LFSCKRRDARVRACWPSLLAALLTAAMAVFSGAASAQQVVDRVIASVDGEPITMHDVKAFSASSGTPIPDESDPRAPDMIRKALKTLIEDKLLESETKTFASQVDDSQVDKFIARMREQNNLSEQQFKEELLREGTTWEQFRRRARLEVEKMIMLDKDVRSKVKIPDAEVKAYYNSHQAEFTNQSERFKLAQILIAVSPNAPSADIAAARAKAEEIRKRAAGGEDFHALAGQLSDDDSKSKGGELGYFAPDEMIDQIRAGVAGLKPGEISKLIRTSHGFHILKVEEHDTVGPKPFAEVEDEIRDKLTDAKAKENFRQFVDQDLVKNHHIESFY